METKKLKKGKFSAVTIPMLLLFIVIIALTLLQFISIFLASFRPGNEIMRQGLGLNLDFSKMDLNSYRLLFTGDNQNYFTYFFNSLKLTALQTTLTLIFSAFVAYGFSMYNFRGKTLLFGLVLLMMTTPVEILMLPLFLEMTKLHLYDSLWAIILPQITAPLPIFFFRIILPLMKPSFAAMGIFVGMNSWNSYVLPAVLLRDKKTLPVFLESLLSPYKNNYDLLIVGAVVSVIPIVILFAMFQRHFISGMTAGGVKG